MSESALLLATALYWAVYGIAVVVALPVSLALLFGAYQTAKWFMKGGKTNPHRHQG